MKRTVIASSIILVALIFAPFSLAHGWGGHGKGWFNGSSNNGSDVIHPRSMPPVFGSNITHPVAKVSNGSCLGNVTLTDDEKELLMEYYTVLKEEESVLIYKTATLERELMMKRMDLLYAKWVSDFGGAYFQHSSDNVNVSKVESEVMRIQTLKTAYLEKLMSIRKQETLVENVLGVRDERILHVVWAEHVRKSVVSQNGSSHSHGHAGAVPGDRSRSHGWRAVPGNGYSAGLIWKFKGNVTALDEKRLAIAVKGAEAFNGSVKTVFEFLGYSTYVEVKKTAPAIGENVTPNMEELMSAVSKYDYKDFKGLSKCLSPRAIIPRPLPFEPPFLKGVPHVLKAVSRIVERLSVRFERMLPSFIPI